MDQIIDLLAIRWWIVVGGIVISFIVGSLWYGPFFGAKFMVAAKFSREDAANMPKGEMAKTYSWTVLFSIINTYTLAVILKAVGSASIISAIFISVFLWLGFYFVKEANHYNFTPKVRSSTLFSLNIGYELTITVLTAIFIQAFQ